ncbi:peptidase inhibitor [Fragilaria crotonensis]|nr:peptidase inhibitor [Fragilaria crotonensis]
MGKPFQIAFLATLIALTTILPTLAFFTPYKSTSSIVSPFKFSGDNQNEFFSVGLSESDQGVVGAVGTAASLITLYSEYTLKTTGCGLPAGPAGLLGLAEGLSYLSVVGIGAFSLYTKLKQGRGLPAGPGGLLGAAEGLSFLAIVAGLVVLVFQIVDYNYIPNAVPMEGGMCN